MRFRTEIRTLMVMFFAALTLSIAPSAQAQECSLAGVAGSYGLTDSGTVVGVGPRAAVGRFTLDAAGNLMNGVATSSLNGSIADETFSGTYTVNPDCTGTIGARIFASGVELFAVNLNMVFDDNMREIRAIFTSVVEPNGTHLSTVIALEARKLFTENQQ